ncbi:MAG: hypothetical protein ACO1PB_04665 [Ramlibacter sp.]
MVSSIRARVGADQAAARGQFPLQKLPSAALAALLACGLSGCGGSPSEADVRGALAAQIAAVAGQPSAAKAEADKIKLVGCKEADGSHRCDWTGTMGGGSGRFVKKDGAWVLVGS